MLRIRLSEVMTVTTVTKDRVPDWFITRDPGFWDRLRSGDLGVDNGHQTRIRFDGDGNRCEQTRSTKTSDLVMKTHEATVKLAVETRRCIQNLIQ